ncbi:hypothetical protein PAXINDRAFT_131220 [Paxillus involutus ATCC 200175]|nr:hypothetical protein PAXINDRAFT_131220 [Paxillus involutus ATCC 200175]
MPPPDLPLSSLPLWLRFLDETSKIVTALTAGVCLYTRSAGVIYFAAGSLACALSAKLVKMAIRQERPAHGRKVTYGMPSTHASACTFFAAYAPLASLYLPLHPNLGSLAVYAPIIIVPWAGMIVLSRVWLGHHTWPQVAAGSVFGICFASLWFRLWVDNAGGIRTLGEEMEELVNSLLGT